MKVPIPVSFAASIALLAPLSLLVVFAPAAYGQDQLWITQFGTAESELESVALARDDTGGVYIAGETQGSLGGPNAGGIDAYLARYDGAGNRLWIRQFGTTADDEARDVAPDGSGGVIVTGFTRGLLGAQRFGSADAFIARYDRAGNRLWIRQFGTPDGDVAQAIASDGAGGAIVVGLTGFARFLAHYDSEGNQLWLREFSLPREESAVFDLAPDGAGGVMMAGRVPEVVGGIRTDAFVARFDGEGNQLWIRVFGTFELDQAFAVASDGAGGAMVAGRTLGDLGGPNAGGGDAFLARYDSAGNQLWLIQFGTSNSDGFNTLAPDGVGGAIVAGFTHRSLWGPHAGGQDVILARFDDAGNQIWIRQFGSSDDENGNALAADGAGGVMVGGRTSGSLGGPNAGGFDPFLARYTIDSCYPDCDQSTGFGVLDLFDFLCFQGSFVNSEPYACDCDTSTGPLVCDLFDFLCFQGAFVGGCG